MYLDLFDNKLRPEKGHPRSNIYTGEGSNVDVRLGRCEDLIKDVKDCSIHAIITDPPFQVLDCGWDVLPTTEFWNECYRVLLHGSHLVFFGQVSRMPEIFKRMSQTEFEFRDIFVWNHAPFFPKGFKTEDEAFRSKVRNGFTPIFVYRKKLETSELENWNKYHTNLLSIDDTRMEYKNNHTSIIKKFEETGEKHHQSNIGSATYGDVRGEGWVPNTLGCVPTNSLYCPRPTRKERTINEQVKNEHPTVKPVSLLLHLTRLFTNSPEQKILDPWVGTGTGGMAARYCTRKFIGFDISEEYVELAKYRIKHVFDLDEECFNKIKLV